MGTVTPTRALPTISAAAIEEKITALHGRLAEVEGQPNRYCVPRDRAPTILERRQLSAACAHLEARLEPCHDRLVIEAVVSQFLIPYDTARDADPKTTEARNERYVNALLGQPVGAIQAAVGRFDSASTILPVNPSFRPKPAELAAEVKAGLTGIRTKLVHVRRILAAEVYDPPTDEEKARVEEATRQFLDDRKRALQAETQARPPHVEDLRALDLLMKVDALREACRGPDLNRLMSNLDRRQVSA